MKVNPYTRDGGCGGGITTAKIMINDSVSVCHTKAIQYPTGKTVVWQSEDQLKDCAETKFNPKASKIFYTVKPTDIDENYCINEVSVILDDQQLTEYMRVTDQRWRMGSWRFLLTRR